MPSPAWEPPGSSEALESGDAGGSPASTQAVWGTRLHSSLSGSLVWVGEENLSSVNPVKSTASDRKQSLELLQSALRPRGVLSGTTLLWGSHFFPSCKTRFSAGLARKGPARNLLPCWRERPGAWVAGRKPESMRRGGSVVGGDPALSPPPALHQKFLCKRTKKTVNGSRFVC